MKFKCIKCSYCCTLKVKLSFIEYLRILLNGHRNFSTKNFKGEKVIKQINNDCFFLKRNPNGCRIYSIRPSMCKNYPGLQE